MAAAAAIGVGAGTMSDVSLPGFGGREEAPQRHRLRSSAKSRPWSGPVSARLHRPTWSGSPDPAPASRPEAERNARRLRAPDQQGGEGPPRRRARTPRLTARRHGSSQTGGIPEHANGNATAQGSGDAYGQGNGNAYGQTKHDAASSTTPAQPAALIQGNVTVRKLTHAPPTTRVRLGLSM